MDFTFNFFANNTAGKSTAETAGSLALSADPAETAGSLAYLLGNDGGPDSFGSKDMFGTPDFSNMDASFFVADGSVETAGSLACAGSFYDGGFSGGSFSGGGDFGGGSVGGGASSCGGGGGGGFSSVC